MNCKVRKQIRLNGFDYKANHAYFVTICTHNGVNLFGKINDSTVGADSISARMIKKVFLDMIYNTKYYDCLEFVVMPNHVHALITIIRADMESAPTECSEVIPLPNFIQAFKRKTTIEYIKLVKEGILPRFDKKIWQRGYYEHIIRNDEDMFETRKYIRLNPAKWKINKH